MFSRFGGILRSSRQLSSQINRVRMSKRKAPQGENPNKDICDILFGETSVSDHRVTYYYCLLEKLPTYLDLYVL